MEELFELLKYAFLGLLQGFTEPIPISSSGHLEIAERLFDLKIEGLSFSVLMNFASLLAVLLIYRSDLIRLTVNGFSYVTNRNPESKSEFMFIVYLIIGTIPAGVLGILFGDYIEENLTGMKVVGGTLVITGLALWYIRNMKGRKNEERLSFKDALIVGFGQAVALIPGISRSGATIVAAMSLGMKQETALRFSFLLYIPVSVGTMLLGASDIINDPNFSDLFVPYMIAFMLSLISSYFSLKWLMNIMAEGNLKYFAYYCFIVGPLVFFFLG
ncbi:undecaprenyl-diphosphate phosphatase [Pseudalkalibacillus caeni]|uniref:Undecaprenyl-diphosphatase n=1 Tax=Exobacillus caeni TaxID=2574798 RepID=A0A5R9FDX0_9BACL|nr:undecaprenyl-diphosphate phosphatase [Pseudalkalibacillus caeni]TLS37825.1 undecaprenyl-diphosphate phosphatase [Pseudalkalibacillus caeni]